MRHRVLTASVLLISATAVPAVAGTVQAVRTPGAVTAPARAPTSAGLRAEPQMTVREGTAPDLHAGSAPDLADGAALASVSAARTAGGGVGLRGRWQWPLQPRPTVVHRFDAPAHRYGAGHRGVDLATGPGAPVRAVAAGRVSHVGVIAGRGTVSVLHADGIRSTYEPVTPSVTVGASVAAGGALGVVAATPGHCAPSACLHLGAIRGETYLDPLALLGAAPVILLPMRS
ncbi:murein hydrolase activator EnvC family protein [Actinomycetota bacterium]